MAAGVPVVGILTSQTKERMEKAYEDCEQLAAANLRSNAVTLPGSPTYLLDCLQAQQRVWQQACRWWAS